MDGLEIFDLYQKENKGKTLNFMKHVNSSLRVQSNYEGVVGQTEWIGIMEDTIQYLDNIFRNPNRFIINEEEIVKIELARKITVESVKHLAKNTNLIQEFDNETGEVKPSKILNINKEESYDTYENRFIYSLIQLMKFFISKKKKAVEEKAKNDDKNEKQINYKANSKVLDESIDINIELKSKLDALNKENKEEILGRITRLERKLKDITSLELYQIIDKKRIALVTSPIKKTNVILRNVNFQYAVKLWNYIQENLDDTPEYVNEKQDYMDDSGLKNLADEVFLLNYLILRLLDKDDEEFGEDKEKAKEQITDLMLEKIVELNNNVTQEELKSLVENKIAVVKYRNLATINEIQKVFKKYIDKYLETIK